MLDRRDAWHTSPVTRDRLLEVNRQALEFYRAQYTPQCWSRAYLTERLGVDIADDPRFQPGHAPDSWTALTHHLRQHGVTDEEMELAGLVTRTRDGRIVDRFRNRLILPIVHNSRDSRLRRPPPPRPRRRRRVRRAEVPQHPRHAAVQQRRPAVRTRHRRQPPSAVPVLVEGPLDAIAITLGRRRPVRRVRTPRHLPHQRTSRQLAQLRAFRSRSWPPTTTSPARSPPNAPTGCSPSTASTHDTPPGPPAPTPPTPSTARSRRRRRRPPHRPAARRHAHRRAPRPTPRAGRHPRRHRRPRRPTRPPMEPTHRDPGGTDRNRSRTPPPTPPTARASLDRRSPRNSDSRIA